MPENTEYSIGKNSILLSRNRPVALVVGAAGFLGSHLVDKLLQKDVQVIGVDSLKLGKKENLRQAIENKDFHFIIDSADDLDLSLERLDYVVIAAEEDLKLRNVLKLFKEFKSRCLFISSIDLYDKEKIEGLGWLKDAEGEIAKFATEYGLNARILRLGPVYGPRMHFKNRDPIIRLIRQALTSDLQRDVALDFSSRALYILDAADLAVRTIFAGSTAQKIFDGVLPVPVKVSEAKQVLLDPVWYENRQFAPTELPPWPTPNLEKTIKFLNWQPNADLVVSLKRTLNYFKDNEIELDKDEQVREEDIVKPVLGKKIEIEDDKKGELELFKQGLKRVESVRKKGGVKHKFFPSFSKIYLFGVIALITYALIWPAVIFFGGILTFRSNLNDGLRNLEKGELEKGLVSIKAAKLGLEDTKEVFDSLEPIRKTNIFSEYFSEADKLLSLADVSASSISHAILGMQQMLQSLKAVSGEKTESPAAYFKLAQIELSAAQADLAKAQVLSKDESAKKNIQLKLDSYSNLIRQAKVMSVLLPKLTAVHDSKTYLILLQNNMELRPAGGFIGSFAKVVFTDGKLKKLDVNDIYAIDGQLTTHIEPPKEIKEDLGQKDWYLRDSNWESDFPTSARQAEWFYTKETGETVDGVIALDVSAMEKLLSAIGSLDLPDYTDKIVAENLFEKAVTYAETGFFPGSQAKKSFLTALSNQMFNKIFFLPQNNWPAIISGLNEALEEKHISVYLNDPKLFSYIDSEGWTHELPRQSSDNRDFLSLVEANLGANKVNFYLNRSYKLETVVGKDGEVSHRARVSYTNRSPSEAFPGGRYKNRMRIYLPFGSKLTRALWGEKDITQDVTGFVDYGRSGFSLLLELSPKEQKTLVLDYSVPVKLEFKQGQASYKLDIIKQAGTLKDPLEWTITYPISYQIISGQTKNIGPQEQTIKTDLSRNRSFEVEFKK